MPTDGIEYVYLETRNWGKTVKFWQELGFKLDLDLGNSGRLVHPRGGAALFINEVPEGRPLAQQIYLQVPDASFRPRPPVEIARDWHASHWSTRLMEVRDPDGRVHVLQHGHGE